MYCSDTKPIEKASTFLSTKVVTFLENYRTPTWDFELESIILQLYIEWVAFMPTADAVCSTFLVFAQTDSNNARGLEHTGLIFEFCSMISKKYTDSQLKPWQNRKGWTYLSATALQQRILHPPKCDDWWRCSTHLIFDKCSMFLQTQSRLSHTFYRNFHFNEFVANALHDNIG